MAVPKRRKSKMRIRQRKAHLKHIVPTLQACPQCGKPQLPHRVCPSCGTYRGRKILTTREAE